jgi:hypothetical protein
VTVGLRQNVGRRLPAYAEKRGTQKQGHARNGTLPVAGLLETAVERLILPLFWIITNKELV